MNRRLSAATRRVVLGTAFVAALAAWLFPHSTLVGAAPPQAPMLVQAANGMAGAAEAAAPDAAKAPEHAPDADAEARSGDRTGTDVTIDRHGIRVDKGRKHVTVQAFGGDREYDSFESFVQDAPWLAGLVFLVVLMVFLVPLLIIVLLIWYKLRKNRMQNETMLKLAEKGVVPPAEAMAALDASGVPSGPTTTPLYEQAKQIRQRAVASDLRKGVIMLAAGLALSLWSILDDGSANSVGMVLLFVGIGYCVLWFVEDRSPGPRAGGSLPPPPGGA
ncbi:MAG: DUF6249 domain-containing protein [Betaproteobacteria bacterium]